MGKIANSRALGALFEQITKQLFSTHEKKLFDAQVDFLQENLYHQARTNKIHQICQILGEPNADGTYGIFKDSDGQTYVSEETVYAVSWYLIENIQGVCKQTITESIDKALTHTPDYSHMKPYMRPIVI